jgi:type II secretory pathway component PulC
MLALIPILAIIMIFMFRQVLSKAPQQSRAATEDDVPIKTSNTNKTSGDDIHWDIPEAMPVTLRDPIKPVSKDTPAQAVQNQSDSNNTDTVIVRGVLYSDEKPSAVIGNRLVHINDEIDGAKIVWIDRNSVTFEKNGEKWTIKVAELKLGKDKEKTEQK